MSKKLKDCAVLELDGEKWIRETPLTRAAADLLAAAKKLEEAELFHANCEECEGQDVPELCSECFPLFDDARCMRLAAIAKAEGRPE